MPNKINPADVIWDTEGIVWDEPTPSKRPLIRKDWKQRVTPAIKGTARLGMAGIAEPIKQVAIAVEPTMGRPALEIGGALTGAALASPGNIPAPGLASLTGSGLGYAAGRRAADVLDIRAGRMEPRTLRESLDATVRDVPIGAAMEVGGPVLGKVGRGLKMLLPRKTAGKVIDVGIKKGIRPSTVGQHTQVQRKQYVTRSRDAVDSIVANKQNLNLVDELGVQTNKLPQTLDEFSQAIENTKKQVFKEYNTLATQAGKEGAVVNLNKIADELKTALVGPRARPLSRFKPQYVKKINDMANRLRKDGKYTAEEAQEAIKMFNEDLRAFYKNPDAKTASDISIGAMIANNMRKQLDEVIEKTTGAGYQGLKNTYASLKAIEKDVNKRAGVDARKNIKGLIDFSDIFSGHQVVEGLLKLSPSKLVAGGATKMIASLYKHLNNPNAIIKNMFADVEKLRSPKAPPSPGMIKRGVAYEALKQPAIQPEAEGTTPASKSDIIGNILGSVASPAYAEGVPSDKTPMGNKSARAGTKAYLDEDYNGAITSFQKAMKEDPANAQKYSIAINQAKEEQKALGLYYSRKPAGSEATPPTKSTPVLSKAAGKKPLNQLSDLTKEDDAEALTPLTGSTKKERDLMAEYPVIDTLHRSGMGGLHGKGVSDDRSVDAPISESLAATPMSVNKQLPAPVTETARIGINAYLSGDYLEAIKAFQKAMKEDPKKAKEYQQAIDQAKTEYFAMMEYD